MTARARRHVRSIFLSDIHLGCRYSRAGELLALLNKHEPEYLYLVGDIIDGWRLRRKWLWHPEYSRLLQRIIELASQGVSIRYTPGNHDAFLRPFVNDFGFVEIADEFRHDEEAEKPWTELTPDDLPAWRQVLIFLSGLHDEPAGSSRQAEAQHEQAVREPAHQHNQT